MALADGMALYRIWGDADLLLYIGISDNFGRRWRQHAKQQPWWDEMRRLTVDEWFGSRAEAEAAETIAIRSENPKYNIAKVVERAIVATVNELPVLWVDGSDEVLDQMRRIATSPCRDSNLIRLMLIALVDGYRELPAGRELEDLAAKISMCRATAYRVARRAKLGPVQVQEPGPPDANYKPAA